MWNYCIWSVILGLFTLAYSNPRKMKEGNKCTYEPEKSDMCKELWKCRSDQNDLEMDNKRREICNTLSNSFCCEGLETTVAKAAETINTVATTTTAPEITPTTTLTTENPITEFGRKSKDKCYEYSKWLDPPGFLPGSGKRIPGKCGIFDQPKISDRSASSLEFPHMALLGYGNMSSLTYKYSASIISEQFLLGTAHCLLGQKGPLVAKLGNGDRSNRKIVKVAEMIFHPKYAYPQKYNDIALIRLEEPLIFTDYIRPACLQIANITFKNEPAVESFFKRGDDHILKKYLPILNQSQCSEIYPKNFYLQAGIDENTMMCAGVFNNDKNEECYDDAGGPLQVIKNEPNCMYGIIGVASFGKYCSVVPDVFTRISNYIPWIESIVWPDLSS